MTDQDYNNYCATMPAKKKKRVAMYITQGHIVYNNYDMKLAIAHHCKTLFSQKQITENTLS